MPSFLQICGARCKGRKGRARSNKRKNKGWDPREHRGAQNALRSDRDLADKRKDKSIAREKQAWKHSTFNVFIFKLRRHPSYHIGARLRELLESFDKYRKSYVYQALCAEMRELSDTERSERRRCRKHTRRGKKAEGLQRPINMHLCRVGAGCIWTITILGS